MNNTDQQPISPTSPAVQNNASARLTVGVFALVLFGIMAGGLWWLFTQSTASPIGAGWFLFSFAAGLSMIVLPCTFPLAFVIVPLTLGKSPAKGLLMALMFSLGVAITLSMYGVLAAVLGKALFAFTGGGGEIIKNIFYAIAGIFAIVFGLADLGFIKVRMPTYSGPVPALIQNRTDIFKPLLLGLFLGNIGVGCPHPATPIILGQIGITADIFYGWLLFFVHALGRITPLLVLAMLGIIGVNAIQALIRHREGIQRATAWGMVFVGAFLFTMGFFGHDWWVYSGQHVLWEDLTQEARFTGMLSERFEAVAPHTHGIPTGTGLLGVPLAWGNWVFVLLMILPVWWYWLRKRNEVRALPEGERAQKQEILAWQKWFFAALTLIFILLFVQIVPHQFLEHRGMMQHEEMEEMPISRATLGTFPSVPLPGEQTQLAVSLNNENGGPLQGLQISHERILHAIIIHEDFSTFAHIHPEDFGEVSQDTLRSTRFVLPYIFPKAGRYIVALDWQHEEHHQSQQFLTDVGEGRGVTTLVKDISRTKIFGEYRISFETEPYAIRSGEERELSWHITKGGAPLSDLEGYLGAPMHVAVVSSDLSTFMHTHGEVEDPMTGEEMHDVSADDRFGPFIHAHVRFPHAGIYAVFGEFRHEGQVTTTMFMVEVEQGADTTAMPHEEEGGHTH